jgi:hypothetical protein
MDYRFRIAISLVIVIFMAIALYYGLPHQQENVYERLSDKELVELWEETSITTDIHLEAYKELDKRGYFEEERNKSEVEANKKLNELLNN